MRTLNRNKSPFWYLLYDSKVPAKDEYGNETGEGIEKKEDDFAAEVASMIK